MPNSISAEHPPHFHDCEKGAVLVDMELPLIIRKSRLLSGVERKFFVTNSLLARIPDNPIKPVFPVDSIFAVVLL